MDIKNLILRRALPVVGGALLGYLYYEFYGCDRGCPITGNPYTSMAYGAFMGLVLAIPGKKKDNNNGNEREENN